MDYILVWDYDIMKPRSAGINSVCLVVTLLFLDAKKSSEQHYILLDWLGYWWLISCTDFNCYVCCHRKQLCLAVSLISTAANSAWDGEFRVKCRQGCSETVVGWQEGTDGGKGKVCTCTLVMIHLFIFAAHDYVFSVGWFIKTQHVWCPGNQVSGLSILYYYCLQSNTTGVLAGYQSHSHVFSSPTGNGHYGCINTTDKHPSKNPKAADQAKTVNQVNTRILNIFRCASGLVYIGNICKHRPTFLIGIG